MRAFWAVLRLDARGIARDHVALATVLLSLTGTVVLSGLGLAQSRLPGWSDWMPFAFAVSLVGAPAGFGFLFGVLMVEEGETMVRQALTVSPLPAFRLMLVRTMIATAWTAVWPLTSVLMMNATWRAVDLPVGGWLMVVAPLALLTPAFALVIPALARDKVAALAVFKTLSFIALAPLGLWFVPEAAGYRAVFLLSPTAWVVEAFRSLVVGGGGAALWAVGAGVYAVALLLAVIHVFRRNVYRTHA